MTPHGYCVWIVLGIGLCLLIPAESDAPRNILSGIGASLVAFIVGLIVTWMKI
jgi:hypothetical protein